MLAAKIVLLITLTFQLYLFSTNSEVQYGFLYRSRSRRHTPLRSSLTHSRDWQVRGVLEVNHTPEGTARYGALDKWTLQLNKLQKLVLNKMAWSIGCWPFLQTRWSFQYIHPTCTGEHAKPHNDTSPVQWPGLHGHVIFQLYYFLSIRPHSFKHNGQLW